MLQKAGLVLFGLALAALLLVLGEGLLAVVGWGDEARFEDPFVGFEPGRDLFTRSRTDDGTEILATHPEKLAFFNQQQFPAEKGERAYRIFALGGSTTAGRPYDAAVAFPQWLEVYLTAVDPDRDWQVINAGGISYASYRLVVLMRELLRYDPDLFVVYTGHNEFLEERTYSELLDLPPTLRRLRLWFGNRRLYGLARRGVTALVPEREASEGRLAAEVAASLDGWTGIDDYRRGADFKRETVEHFGFNLRRLVALARGAGAEILFVRPVSNLKDFSPFKSEHRAELDPAERARFATHLAAARDHLKSGDYSKALTELETATAIDAEYAEVHYLAGRAHFALGEPRAAHEAFVRAKDLDVAPLRATEALIATLDAVVAELEVEVLDLPALLEAESMTSFGHPILGNELLLDHVHPDIPVHSRIAEALVERLQRLGIAADRRQLTDELRRRLYADRLATLDASYYAYRDLNLAKVLGWAGKLEEAEAPLRRAATVLHDHPEVRLNLGTLYQKTGRFTLAATELALAAELDPEVAETHFNLGVVQARLGELDAAVASLEQAIRLRADYPEAHFNLGVLLRRRGELEAALAALERARSARGDAPEILSQIGTVRRLQGRLDVALETLDRSLARKPDDPATLAERGVTLAQLDRLEEAQTSLERALAIDPAHAEALYNLGLVLSRQGRTDEAIATYRRATQAGAATARVWNNLGILYGRLGRLEEARSALAAAIENEPDYAEAHFNLGVVYDAAGRTRESLESLRRAANLEPENGRFHLALATLLAATGARREALEHYELAAANGAQEAEGPIAQLRSELGRGR